MRILTFARRDQAWSFEWRSRPYLHKWPKIKVSEMMQSGVMPSN